MENIFLTCPTCPSNAMRAKGDLRPVIRWPRLTMPDEITNPLDFFDSVLATHPLSEVARRALAVKIRLFLQSFGNEVAPADEIEITSEMMEAGYKASLLYDREDPKEWEIAAVYRAMEGLRRKS